MASAKWPARRSALHPDVAKITFTGSTDVGKLILQYAGQSNMKQVALECGGKSPQVFVADVRISIAPSPRPIAASFPTWAKCVMPARDCWSIARSATAFVERFIELGKDAYQPGDPLDPATNMGPLVTREAQQRVLGLIEAGRREGARLQFGGEAPQGLDAARTSRLLSSPTCATT